MSITEKVRSLRNPISWICISLPCLVFTFHHHRLTEIFLTFLNQELEEKERRLRENIAKNYGRIQDVTRELSDLQLELRVLSNVGPKKHGLELIRRKIEIQTERISAAQRANAIAQKSAAQTAEALATEERVKEQLCQELNLLVKESARSQLDKLEQLSKRLESLNAGLAIAGHEAEPGVLEKASALQQDAEALRGALLITAGETTHPSTNPPPTQTQPQQLATNHSNRNDSGFLMGTQEALQARGRHVQLPAKQLQGASHNNNNLRQSQQVGDSGNVKGKSMMRSGVPMVQKSGSNSAGINNAGLRESRDAHGTFHGFE